MFHIGKRFKFMAGSDAAVAAGFLMIISLTLTSTLCLADTIDAAPYLRTTSGARSLGMGGAFTAVADDATSGIWNPAGLAKVKTLSITAFTSKLSADRKHNFIAVGLNPGPGSLGITLINIGVDNISGYNDAGKATGNFDYSANAVGLAYGLGVGAEKKVNIGAGLKILNDRFGLAETESKVGFGGLDAGIIIDDVLEVLSLGAAVKNLGGKISEATVPILIDVGVAAKLLNKNQAIFAFDLEKELGGLNENTFAVKIGAEYWIAKVVALRAGGQKTKFMRSLFTGFGVRVSGLQLDYAFNLGDDTVFDGKSTHYASLTYTY